MHERARAIPTHIDSLNAGLSTLQFSTVSVNPATPRTSQGGTQDNGTWEGLAGVQSWAADDVRRRRPVRLRRRQPGHPLQQLLLASTRDVNFQNGDPDEVGRHLGAVLRRPERGVGVLQAGDRRPGRRPARIYAGLQHVWRTKDNGGNQADLEANCPEFTTSGDQPGCGDFVALGDPSGKGGAGHARRPDRPATASTDKSGGYVVNDRAHAERPVDDVGRHPPRPRVRLARTRTPRTRAT